MMIFSERWGPGARSAGEEAALAARVISVRGLWGTRAPRAPSPPPHPRKIRARRRQPRRLAALAPPPPAYCLDAPARLLCDPSCKFDTPRPPQLVECQRAMGRLSASVQALMRASAARCPPYRGTNVSRYAPTSQRPTRCPDKRFGVWWPRDHPSPRLDHKFHLHHNAVFTQQATVQKDPDESKTEEIATVEKNEAVESQDAVIDEPHTPPQSEEKAESPKSPQKEKVIIDGELPSTSSIAMDSQGSRKKRLYSTVLSMSAPAPINITTAGCVRLSQKLAPGLLKLNPKIVLPARLRSQHSDNKFEELEKEALEQYKASDESIDTKFRELEKQAVEQYSTSNSNTSCSSGNSAEKKNTSSSSSVPENENKEPKKQPAKFHKEKAIDKVVIYSQNFPDLNPKAQARNSSLKNFHTPPRGEKKEQNHRTIKSSRNTKNDSQRAASDTDYEARESNKGSHKGSSRWNLHIVPPKKRHLSFCVSDFSSDEEREDAVACLKDAGPCIRNRGSGKMKLSAHGGGDLIMRKT